MNHICLLLCLLGISACFIADAAAFEAIIDGDLADAAQFPYQVSLEWYNQSFCGGGIIDYQFILTAAHCVFKNNQVRYTPLYVLAGVNDLEKIDQSSMKVKVVKIFVPINFTPLGNATADDIAVLKLKDPLQLPYLWWGSRNVKSLSLPKHKHENYDDKEVKIAGFGWDWINIENKANYNGGNHRTQLRFALADVISIDECQQYWSKRKITKRQICAKIRQRNQVKPRGVCVGDSGGPLVYGGKFVVGILSVGTISCSEKNQAAIYVRVSEYLDFIENAMKGIKSNNALELIP